MKSFYIGPAGSRLYCNLHEPTSRLVRDLGIVLCPPLGHEYYRSYRAHVRLAEALADTGFTVMRFDYLGTGDSEGPMGHARLDGWIQDAERAARHLLEENNVGSVVFTGLRFGGLIAAAACGRVPEAVASVLWEPVLEGKTYIKQLRSLHQAILKDQERFPRARHPRDTVVSEYVGHVYGIPLLEDLNTAYLERMLSESSRSVLLASKGYPESDSVDRLPERNTACFSLGHDGYGWTDPGRISETVVDPVANRRLSEVLEEVAA